MVCSVLHVVKSSGIATAIGHSAALLVPPLQEETFPLLCSHSRLCRSLQMSVPSSDQHGKVIFGSSEALGWVIPKLRAHKKTWLTDDGEDYHLAHLSS